MRFHHAGIATEDADALVDLYRPLLDCEVAHRETFGGMKMVFLDVGDAYFEILEPLGEEGAIASYLAENGPGIHHLALVTDDVVGALGTARDHGVTCIDDEPREGAWGHEVAFLHPRDTGGVLLEYVSR